MEASRDNPNEALTPYYDGDEIRYVPVIEYYVLVSHPEQTLARLALKETLEESEDDG